jgi:two-component system, response regulator, stage 0 sporulation protein F
MSEAITPTPAIMLVEDEPEILFILQRLMLDLVSGYDIVAVRGGAEALAQLGRRPVPLMITDYRMPGMNGLDLTQAVKAASPATHVLIITAERTPDIEARAYAAGAEYFLGKPFPLEDLRQIIRAVLT